MNDCRYWTGAIGKKERSIGNRSRRRDSRDLGSSTSVHAVWMGHSARDCRWPAGEAGFPGRRRHLCSGAPVPLLYRFLSTGGVVIGNPPVGLLLGAPPLVPPPFLAPTRTHT